MGWNPPRDNRSPPPASHLQPGRWCRRRTPTPTGHPRSDHAATPASCPPYGCCARRSQEAPQRLASGEALRPILLRPPTALRLEPLPLCPQLSSHLVKPEPRIRGTRKTTPTSTCQQLQVRTGDLKTRSGINYPRHETRSQRVFTARKTAPRSDSPGPADQSSPAATAANDVSNSRSPVDNLIFTFVSSAAS